MLKKVLVANRGEIAVRIIRTCRELGIETVAVFSTADADAIHVQLATEAICIGPPKATDSYLNIQNIVAAAEITKCDGIHPGFGFLSENAKFAEACEKNNIKFIGPSSEVINKMGNKVAAREIMKNNGVPVVPGSDGNIKDFQEAEEIAEKLGYPVLIKAAAGGGGRGMRKAFSKEEIKSAFMTAQAETMACFNDDEMYIEKLIESPKHIEFQIIGDGKGNAIHLGERDCSIQRRNQKMLEETPSTSMNEKLRDEMGKAAVKAAQAVNYQNAGTVEFVLDDNDNFYFIEMNTRIQVEHPITEMVTGIDIVAQQLKIASGLPLLIKQEDVKFNGHAIECRVTAEDIFNDFMPNPGKIDFLHFPSGFGVRVDSALFNGCEISPYYDSMVAKIIVHGDTRLEAIRRMRRALEETVISGVKTTLSLQHLLMFNMDFIRGKYNTGFMEKHLKELLEINKTAGGVK
ncbi:MAG: acetyl-CoA carboxylase biotin carboxylase subunit [Anaerovoracaceae bacterium]